MQESRAEDGDAEKEIVERQGETAKKADPETHGMANRDGEEEKDMFGGTATALWSAEPDTSVSVLLGASAYLQSSRF